MDENAVTNSPADGTAKVEPIKPPFVSVDDAAVYLGKLSRREVYRLLDLGDLKAVPYGRRRLVVVSSLHAYAKKLLDQLDPETRRELALAGA